MLFNIGYKFVFGICEVLDGIVTIFTPWYGRLVWNLVMWKTHRAVRKFRERQARNAAKR